MRQKIACESRLWEFPDWSDVDDVRGNISAIHETTRDYCRPMERGLFGSNCTNNKTRNAAKVSYTCTVQCSDESVNSALAPPT